MILDEPLFKKNIIIFLCIYSMKGGREGGREEERRG